jgi:serine/threonine protein kinase
MDSWPDRPLPGVHIHQIIDRGPLFDSYAGEMTSTHRPVVVKRFHAQLAEDDPALDILNTTSRLLASLKHPNIFRIYRLATTDTHPYLIHELLTGLSLRDFLLDLTSHGLLLPIHLAARLFNPIANAIDYAHARGIFHRNLNPSNIILRNIPSTGSPSFPLPASFHPSVTNFGLAHVFGIPLSSMLDSGYSHPSYLSPEQLQDGEIDSRTDIYSLGALLHELLSGSPPERPPDTQSSSEIPARRPLLISVPGEAAEIVERALSFSPDARFQRAIDLADELDIATGFKPGRLLPKPVSAGSPPPPTLKMKSPHSRRDRIIAQIFTIFVVILVVATLGILAYLASRFFGNMGQASFAPEVSLITSFLTIHFLDIHHDKI